MWSFPVFEFEFHDIFIFSLQVNSWSSNTLSQNHRIPGWKGPQVLWSNLTWYSVKMAQNQLNLKCLVLGNPPLSSLGRLFQCLFGLMGKKNPLASTHNKYQISLKCSTLCFQPTSSHPTVLCCTHQAGTWHPQKKWHSLSKRVKFVQSFPIRIKAVTKHPAALLACTRALCFTWAIQPTT